MGNWFSTVQQKVSNAATAVKGTFTGKKNSSKLEQEAKQEAAGEALEVAEVATAPLDGGSRRKSRKSKKAKKSKKTKRNPRH
jgi:hypothetical protein